MAKHDCPSCTCQQETTNEDDDFERLFWPRYRRKVGKLEAKRAYKRLRVSEQMRVLEDIKTRYEGVELQFIPYPATYLRGRRWEDEQTIPDPPRKPEPDGGVARRPIVAEDIQQLIMRPDEAKAHLAALIKGIGK